MSFSSEWLTLRADADSTSRDSGLLGTAACWAAARPQPRILDLGSGTGATRRAFGDRVPGAQWFLADSDPALLAEAEGPDTTPLLLDLMVEVPRAFDVKPDLVTASAFFDLASATWIDSFVARLRDTGAALYAALTYDGTETWHPPHSEDGAVMAAFQQDMQRDKGLGPALGGAAATYLATALTEAGFIVETAQSPWQLTSPRDTALIAALAEGTARAAGASPDWSASRKAASAVTVGHLDIWATPPA